MRSGASQVIRPDTREARQEAERAVAAAATPQKPKVALIRAKADALYLKGYIERTQQIAENFSGLTGQDLKRVEEVGFLYRVRNPGNNLPTGHTPFQKKTYEDALKAYATQYNRDKGDPMKVNVLRYKFVWLIREMQLKEAQLRRRELTDDFATNAEKDFHHEWFARVTRKGDNMEQLWEQLIERRGNYKFLL